MMNFDVILAKNPMMIEASIIMSGTIIIIVAIIYILSRTICNSAPLKSFSLLLIINSKKLKNIIERKTIQLNELRILINDSRYFLLEKEDSNMLVKASTVKEESPDFNKENLFILKITGRSTAEINKYPTKSWLRDNIISETCQIEAVLRLLDASIAENFVPTI